MNWELIVSACINIFGFVVTYFLTTKSLKDEIQKSKVSISLEKMSEIPYKLTNILNTMSKKQIDIEEYTELLSLIYSYCSEKAILITTEFQRLNYEIARKGDKVSKEERYKPLALLTLLITQIKYDLTMEIVNPELWFIMKINDYQTSKLDDVIKEQIIFYAYNLGLNEEFIKDI